MLLYGNFIAKMEIKIMIIHKMVITNDRKNVLKHITFDCVSLSFAISRIYFDIILWIMMPLLSSSYTKGKTENMKQ